MRVLVVCRYKEGFLGNVAPFVKEQVDAVKLCGAECEYYLVKGDGVAGYLGSLKGLKKQIQLFRPDVVHAHFGLCGLLANLQRKVPVVTTYHGSDINDPQAFRLSKISIRLSAWNIFVTRSLMNKAGTIKKCSLIPCGVTLEGFNRVDQQEARIRIGLLPKKRYVLFASAFDNEVKNAPLARKTVDLLDDVRVELLELKGYNREEVMLLLGAADVLLLTSFKEGSPQVVKEAMACGCPVVSVDVGDVKERLKGLDGCYVAQTREPQELAELLRKALSFEGRTDGRRQLLADELDNRRVAEKLMKLYINLMK